MARNDAVSGYAQAIFSVAEAEGVLDEVEDELFRFARALERNPELRTALTDIGVPAERKRALLGDVLGDRASRHTISLVGFVVEQGRARELGGIVDALVRLAAERRNRVVAEVRAAIPLEGEQRERLARALSGATGKQVEVKVIVDPSIVGGVLAQVGDQVIDGSVRRRLEMAREQLSEV